MNRRKFLFLTIASCGVLNAQSKIVKWSLGKYGEFAFEPYVKNVSVMHGVNLPPDDANRGFINNVSMIESTHGVILIDSGSSYEIGTHVVTEVKRVTDKPIIAIINTHSHGDHWFGNAGVKEAYPLVEVYAHNKMQKASEKLYSGKYASQGYVLDLPHEPVYPSKVLYGDQSLSIDAETFKILHPKNAHTNNDIAIIHSKSNTIFMGDLLLEGGLANFGLESSLLGNIAFLEKIYAHKDYAFYVPGHGKSGNKMKAFMPYYHYMTYIKTEAEKAYKEDKDLSELKPIIKRMELELAWQDLGFSTGFVSRFAMAIYNELDLALHTT